MPRIGLLLLTLIPLSALASCGAPATAGERTPTLNPAVPTTGTTSMIATALPAATASAPQASNLGKLAYVQDGDIWVKVLPGGQPKRLTADGRNRRPRWSHSGGWLAFLKGIDVWLVRADGSDAHSIPVAYDYAWSPDGDRLAYVRYSGIYLIPEDRLADGGSMGAGLPVFEPFTSTQDVAARIDALAWNPGGSQLAFLLTRGTPNGAATYLGVWTVDARTTGPNEAVERLALHAPFQSAPVLAGWTPDDASIVFWPGLDAQQPFLRLLPASGKTEALSAPALPYADFVSLSSSGKTAVLAAGAQPATWTGKQIEQIELETGRTVTLTAAGEAAISPVFSPDGRRIAYVSMPDAGPIEQIGGSQPPAARHMAEPYQTVDEGQARQALQQRHLWRIDDLSRPRPKPLTGDPTYRDERPLWSADGKSILFARIDRSGTASLWVIPAEGGTPRQVVAAVTPAPEPMGTFGHIDWQTLFDWWRG